VVHGSDVGWLVAPGNITALAEAMSEAVANPAERNRRGAAARARMHERFDPVSAAKRYVDLYRQVLKHA